MLLWNKKKNIEYSSYDKEQLKCAFSIPEIRQKKLCSDTESDEKDMMYASESCSSWAAGDELILVKNDLKSNLTILHKKIKQWRKKTVFAKNYFLHPTFGQ